MGRWSEGNASNFSTMRTHSAKVILLPVLSAALALITPIVGAIFTTKTGGAGGLNLFVESLSASSSTVLGNTLSLIPLGFAFGAGVVSAVNPCGFALLPTYLAFHLGAYENQGTKVALAQRLQRALFVGGTVAIGIVLLFGLVGVIIGAGVRSLVNLFPWIGLGVGVLLVIVGAWLMAGGKLYSGFATMASSHIGSPSQIGLRGYFLFGVSYGIASLSCTLPIFLAVIGSTLTVQGVLAASSQFILYALGMAAVLVSLTLAIALFKGAMVAILRKALPVIQPLSAWLMLAAGSYIVFYWLSIGGILSKFR